VIGSWGWTRQGQSDQAWRITRAWYVRRYRSHASGLSRIPPLCQPREQEPKSRIVCGRVDQNPVSSALFHVKLTLVSMGRWADGFSLRLSGQKQPSKPHAQTPRPRCCPVNRTLCAHSSRLPKDREHALGDVWGRRVSRETAVSFDRPILLTVGENRDQGLLSTWRPAVDDSARHLDEVGHNVLGMILSASRWGKRAY
jgi:hypothetical protein